MLFKSLAALTALAQFAAASVYITSPTSGTSIKGGANFTIEWEADADKVTPLASSFGTSYVSVYTGSSTRQYLLKRLGTVDPAKVTSLEVSIPASLGPDSSDYFIRVESQKAVDAQSQPLEAFSARFTLTGMTGTFTAAEESANSAIVASTGSSKIKTSTTKKSTAAKTKTSAVVAPTTSAVKVIATTAVVSPLPAVATTSAAVLQSSSVVVAAVASSAGSGTTAAKAAESTIPALATSGAGSIKVQVAALAVAAGVMVLLA